MSRQVPSAVEVWRQYDAAEVRLSAALSERMLELAGLKPGMRVLDVATGRGEPAIRAAKIVAPSGRVLGVDASADMLAMARERAAREGVANFETKVLDVCSADEVGETGFDGALCRWGLMYLAQPDAALRLIRGACRPGAKFVAAVWAEPERVSYFTLPRRVLEKYRPFAPNEFDPHGVFAYADQRKLERDLASAGFRVEHTQEMDVSVMEARTAEEAIAWVRAFGMTKLLNALPDQVQRAWEADFAKSVEAYRKDGFIQLGGVTRIVVAS